MRTPFVSASRMTVVLYRDPWSETPWTRVEAAAIKDGCLARGWTTLLFVRLDKASAVPRWLPTSHIYFAFEDFGMDQLVGAIKLKVQEHGGSVRQPDAASRLGMPGFRGGAYKRHGAQPLLGDSGQAFCSEREVRRQSVPGWVMVAFGAKRTLFGTDAEWIGSE